MVKVVNQDIKGWFYRQYERTLGIAQLWKPGSNIYTIRKRPPYRLPHMKTNSGNSPSGAQKKVRTAFKKCVDCFNASPRTGGVEPPAIGYRSKEWWYEEAGKQTYPDYYGKEFLRWTGAPQEAEQLKDTNYQWHDANWFLKTDEADFITFYDEMKEKYGYPWSAKNNPDPIVTKMNQIVCNEIDYDTEGDMSVCFTPGQTAHNRKGVCDDQSVLHYALTHKALKELGWSDGDIDYRLSCVFNTAESSEHVYNWWQMNNGVTKIVENTYDPNTSPKVIGGMDSWNWTKPEFVYQRFSKSGHWSPKVEANGTIVPLWYFNYFIQATWQTFYNDEMPDWCAALVPCHSTTQGYWKHTGQKWGSTWGAAWSSAYNTYTGMSWAECEYCWDNLNCYANAGRTYTDQYWALISCTKNTLVFKPEEHMSQQKWDDVTILKVTFNRYIYAPTVEGGGIRCVQTDETQDQVHGLAEFYIPKSLCNFEEFSLTFEGLARNSGDLEPPEPALYGSSGSGTNDQISNAKLYCA